jgi:hypothetical protein
MAIGVLPQIDVHVAPEAPAERGAAEPGPRAPSERPPRVFYRIDSRRVTLREYWWGNPLTVVPAALLKLFGVRVSSPTDDPCVETLAPFEAEPHDVPGVIAQRLTLPIQQLTALGFRAPLWHVVDDDVQQAKTYMATLVHASGRAWARVHGAKTVASPAARRASRSWCKGRAVSRRAGSMRTRAPPSAR